MKRIWNRRNGGMDIEQRLRDERPSPPEHLVARLVADIGERRRPSLHVGSRLVFAAALSTFMIGGFASFGGVGYATVNAEAAAQAVKEVVEKAPLVREVTSASDQYREEEDILEEEEEQVDEEPADILDTTVDEQETLPFTGAALVPTFLVGMVLLLLGVLLRRREARRD